MMFRLSTLCICLLFCSTTAARAAAKHEIDEAIKRGAEFLKQSQKADGSWQGNQGSGATALAGLALLESGIVKTSDPTVRKTADHLRANDNETMTYSLALMIFFFDRLGDSRDKPLIKKLGERLRDGQLESGSWTYNCTPRPPQQRSGSISRGVRKPSLDSSNVAGRIGGGDNSNTQFGLMGLWVARRHKVNVTDALSKTDQYFRQQQTDDGGWAYTGGRMGRGTGSMTCAGLLGLLVHQGNQAILRAGTVADLKKTQAGGKLSAVLDDVAVKKGLKRLESFLAGNAAQHGTRLAGLGGELYFWWSVERVAVAYGLKRIGKADWYAEGSKQVLAAQQKDGSWLDYAPAVGTSFAILFLKRANLARDLTGLVTGTKDGDADFRSGTAEEVLRELQERAGPLAAAEIAMATPSRLLAALDNADDGQRTAILQQLHDRKGVEATLALAKAVKKLDGDARATARQLLVQRLTRMTATTLGKYLELDDEELLRASAEAAGAKKDESLTGKLIELLAGSNAEVADAAQAALVNVTGQQFGRFRGAKTSERFVIVRRWQAWWKKQGSDRLGEDRLGE